jgi:polyisoprenoid-binding protein YceI
MKSIRHILIVSFLAVPGSAFCAPVSQSLKKSASDITFAVQSPNPSLRMTGSFEEFRGSFELDPDDVTQSELELTLNLKSLTLPPDQLMQALFAQGILARVAPSPNSFRSSSIERTAGNSYLLHGNYTWMSKVKKVSLPIKILEASPKRSEIQLLIEGSFVKRDVPSQYEALASGAAGSRGWTKAKLVFVP